MTETPNLRALLGDRYGKVIEKSAKALFDAANAELIRQTGRPMVWEVFGAAYVTTAEHALAAVLPDLMARAWDEGLKVGVRSGYRDALPVRPENPYRTEGDPS